MARLRGPGGCPWDREQTFDSIKPYTLEETYEVLEAIDNRDWDELSSELGDLLLQVLFYAQMANEENTFSIDQVLDRLSQKLVDRHPHVFGDAGTLKPDEVKTLWSEWFCHAFRLEDMIKLQLGCGVASRRLPSLSAKRRAKCEARVRERLAEFTPEQLEYRPEVLFAVAG